MSTDEIRRARLYLSRAADPPAPALCNYVAAHGPVSAADRVRAGTAPDSVLSEIHRPEATTTQDLWTITEGYARFVIPGDDDWPYDRVDTRGHSPVSAPLGLWIRGQAPLTDLVRTAVTITGARAATNYGTAVAADFATGLAHDGVTTLSGGAFGVDSAALDAAHRAGGPTVVVLAGGVDVPYPRAHTAFFDRVVADGGLLISEYPISAQPRRSRFAARAHLLAALSAATVIVEAGPRSGTLAVARHARELGRPVYGVPGPITSPNSHGVHDLLRSGAATLITAPDQIDYDPGASSDRE